jgi:hypothetical protein
MTLSAACNQLFTCRVIHTDHLNHDIYMKTIASFLLVFVLFSAFECQHQEAVEPNPENQSRVESRTATLVGKWQLVEYYWSAGGPGQWTKADPAKPYIIEFKANGAYVNDREDCAGQYTAATDQEMIIKVLCSTGEVRQSELSGKILPSGELVIVPTNPICIEGCSYKYKPIQ